MPEVGHVISFCRVSIGQPRAKLAGHGLDEVVRVPGPFEVATGCWGQFASSDLDGCDQGVGVGVADTNDKERRHEAGDLHETNRFDGQPEQPVCIGDEQDLLRVRAAVPDEHPKRVADRLRPQVMNLRATQRPPSVCGSTWR